jgi:hypothetical protein
MRRIATGLALLAVIAAASTSAHAARAVKEEQRFAILQCLGETAGGGHAAVTVSIAGGGERIADVFVWASGAVPFEDPPAAASNPDVPATVGWEGNAITGSVEVFLASTGASLGDATWDLTAIPGERTPFTGRSRDGNHVVRQAGATYPLTVTGTLTLPSGETLVLTACDGSGGENTIFQNAPRAQISVSDVSQAFCELVAADGRRLFVEIDANAVSLREYAAGADPESDAPLVFGSTEDAVYTRTALSATIALLAPTGDDVVPVGEAMIAAAVDAGAPRTTFQRSHRAHTRLRTWRLTLTGSITLPGGRVYDTAGCDAHRQQIQVQFVP